MNPFELENKRNRFLIKLYEMSEGESRNVNTMSLCISLGIDYGTEATKTGKYLKDEGAIDWASFGTIYLTPQGIRKAEELMKLDYVQKELKILNALYEMSNGLPEQFIMITDLGKAVDLSLAELNSILLDLEKRKGLVGGIDHFAWLLPSGIEEIEHKRNHPEQATQHFPSNITIVYGNNLGNISTGGQENAQQINVNVNPDFDDALSKILELIKSSGLPQEDKQEFQNDIEAIKKLALQSEIPQSIYRAKRKIEYLDLALKGTDIALKVSPHFAILYAFFEKLLNQ